MQFRTDINGLRAYAVLAVIIFHFNKQWLPGGFVGVDVFFVISGYLMTCIIFRGLHSQSFSLLKFYSARIRRIIPALLVLIIVLVALGYFFLGPISYRNLTKEAIRSLLFVSNFLYWRETGYFDAAALSKPLLHTWSLSIEWQFYIIYPVILTILAKFVSIASLKKTILVMAILSLGFTFYFTYQSPSAAYFLLPTRIWEMLMGGLIFLYPLNLTKNSLKYALEIIGLGLIVLSIFIISENIPWPGYMALLPTLGAYIVMQANSHSFLTNNLVFQKIGLWSYSLYLYHWPLLFINYRYNLQLNVWIFLTITFILAMTSYYVIEVRKWKVKHVLIALLIASIPIYGVYKTKGASFRVLGKYSLTIEEFNKLYYGGKDFPAYQVAYTHPSTDNNFDYTIIGDSYSQQYAQYLLKDNISTQTWFASACLFTTNYTVIVDKKEYEKCTKFVNSFYQGIDKKEPIIWIQSWDFYTLTSKENTTKLLSLDTNTEEYYAVITASIENMIINNKDRPIYLVGVYTRPTYDIYECLSTSQLSNFITETCDEFITRKNNPINQYLQHFSTLYKNVYFIDPNDGFCDERGCRMLINNEPMFSDMGHLSTFGADIIGKYIFDEIRNYESTQTNE